MKWRSIQGSQGSLKADVVSFALFTLEHTDKGEASYFPKMRLFQSLLFHIHIARVIGLIFERYLYDSIYFVFFVPHNKQGFIISIFQMNKQRGWVTCLKYHSYKMAELGLEPSFSDAKLVFFSITLCP